MGDAVTVGTIVSVGSGVGVGGYTICVTKLHASMGKIKSPKIIRLILIL